MVAIIIILALITSTCTAQLPGLAWELSRTEPQAAGGVTADAFVHYEFAADYGNYGLDSSGNGNNWTNNGTAPEWTNILNGIDYGGFLTFDSVDDVISVIQSNVPAINGSKQYTVAGWMMPDYMNSGAELFQWTAAAAATMSLEVNFYIDSTFMYLLRGQSGTPDQYWARSDADMFPANNWHFFCFRFDSLTNESVTANGVNVVWDLVEYVDNSGGTPGARDNTFEIGYKGNLRLAEIAFWDRYLSNDEVTNYYNETDATYTNLWDDIQVYWTFDEEATDAGNIKNRGTYPHDGLRPGGAANPEWKDGYYRFDGVDDYLETQYTNTIALTDGHTIAFWASNYFWVSQDKPYGCSTDRSPVDPRYRVSSVVQDSVRLELRGQAGSTVVDADATLPTNVWTHLAFVWDDGVIRSYTNGILEQAVTNNFSGNVDFNDAVAEGAYCGAHNLFAGTANSFWQGGIDNLLVHNAALSQAKIQAFRDLPRSQ